MRITIQQTTLFLLLIVCSITLPAQNTCSDLVVAEVKAENISQKKANTDRYRFSVLVRNEGPATYPATPGTEIKLFFSAPGYIKREMATQPVPLLNAGQTTILVFEANVTRLNRQLPEWENMPFPVEICGAIVTMKNMNVNDCNTRNNTNCKKL